MIEGKVRNSVGLFGDFKVELFGFEPVLW